MTNKQLFIQKLSILLREKDDRIKMVLVGQEAVEVFSNAQTDSHDQLAETLLINDLTRHVIDYAKNPRDGKRIANHLTLMSELIIN